MKAMGNAHGKDEQSKYKPYKGEMRTGDKVGKSVVGKSEDDYYPELVEGYFEV